MSTIQKVVGMIVLTGLITTLVYPTHNTASVVKSAQNFFQGAEHTAITGNIG